MTFSHNSITMMEIFLTVILLSLAGIIGWKLEKSHQTKLTEQVEVQSQDSNETEADAN